MKDETAFDYKRKQRDKANKKLIKNRHEIVPYLAGLMIVGGLAGATVGLSLSPVVTPYGALVGVFCAVIFGGNRIVEGMRE
jgi:hypothetical protein